MERATSLAAGQHGRSHSCRPRLGDGPRSRRGRPSAPAARARSRTTCESPGVAARERAGTSPEERAGTGRPSPGPAGRANTGCTKKPSAVPMKARRRGIHLDGTLDVPLGVEFGNALRNAPLRERLANVVGGLLLDAPVDLVGRAVGYAIAGGGKRHGLGPTLLLLAGITHARYRSSRAGSASTRRASIGSRSVGTLRRMGRRYARREAEARFAAGFLAGALLAALPLDRRLLAAAFEPASRSCSSAAPRPALRPLPGAAWKE